MSEYQVIARKWRPQKFADVVGQEHLTRTLRNAIMQNRTGHAYLLVGSRGIGKTTTARILAKALNCTNNQEGEPCCQCESCLSIANGSSLDVVEIDAASQNSVDDVRSLREQVMFAPVNSRYRIYIVDEVHMLSKQAWNAFLKTLEEPPPHVKFIFATTEVHKVLPTIISRCQRFDLRRISTQVIVDRLSYIVKMEKVPISISALEAIARAADGGMRDAQSILDQIITFYAASADDSNPINEKQVLSLFGLTSPQEMDHLLKAILTDDRISLIRDLHALTSQGRDLELLLTELCDQIRAILIAITMNDASEILETTEENVQRLKSLGHEVVPNRIQMILEQLSSAGYGLRNALNKQVYLETILLRSMREAHRINLDEVLARLNVIRRSGELDVLKDFPVNLQSHLPTISTQKEINPTSSGPALDKIDFGKNIPDETWPFSSEKKKDIKVDPVAEPAKTLSSPVDSVAETAETFSSPVDPVAETAETFSSPVDPVAETAKTLSSPSAPVAEPALDGSSEFQIQQLWHNLISDIKENLENIILANCMIEGIPVKCENGILTVVFDSEYDSSKNYDPLIKEKSLLEGCLKRITKGKVKQLELHKESQIKSLAEHWLAANQNLDEMKLKVMQNEYVKEVLTLFDGSIIDVHG